MIHTVKGFGIVNKAEVDGFLELSCFFSDPTATAAKSLQLCPTLRDPMDCSLPGSSVHGTFQAGVLEWGAIAFSIDCVDQNKLENSERDGNTRPPDLPPEESVCRSRSNS